MKQTIPQLKIKNRKEKHLQVHPVNFEKVFDGIERKTWSDLSEWTFKNNSSSVNPLPLPHITEVREKSFGETTNQNGHCHSYALFPFNA